MSSSLQTDFEIGQNQRGLVDSIIEEYQYEAAIDALFQLKAPQYRPHPSHIRQLIYLALHPSGQPSLNDNSLSSVHDSPKKTGYMKTQFPITQKTVTSALDLLASLTSTNSPEALARALPSYATSDPSLPSAYVQEQSGSLLAKQAMCIKAAKHCWEILQEGYIYRTQVITSPKGKSKLRRDYSIEEAFDNEGMAGGSHLVGSNSWAILGWLVSLFERDEQFKEQSDNVRYSPALLQQLPPPRGGSVTRWDFSDILNIIVHCFGQAEPRKRRIGYRLMATLINLTNTIHVDISTLVTSVYRRLLVAGRVDFFESLLSNLPSSSGVWRFKTHFCVKLSIERVSPPETTPYVRPRPQARAAPKPRPMTGSESPKKQVTPPQAEVFKPSLPKAIEVLQCLESPIPDELPEPLTPSVILHAKFEVLLSFASVQAMDTEENRHQWDVLIQEGQLTKSMDIAFGGGYGETGLMYLQMSRELLRIGS